MAPFSGHPCRRQAHVRTLTRRQVSAEPSRPAYLLLLLSTASLAAGSYYEGLSQAGVGATCPPRTLLGSACAGRQHRIRSRLTATRLSSWRTSEGWLTVRSHIATASISYVVEDPVLAGVETVERSIQKASRDGAQIQAARVGKPIAFFDIPSKLLPRGRSFSARSRPLLKSSCLISNLRPKGASRKVG